ncbi:ABC transporter permease [Motilibacter deserti]|uniref:Transport permease protein n=1 Tax=Motilibacter deserti TaxID=2714956 RepID=A0ABX0GSK5_9ACTN|nr:ABC transporter permease [Motilibacter deserti]
MRTVIEPKQTLRIDWRELHSYRELFYYFAWRDIKVRYKQTVVGASWAVFQPFVTMIVFTVFFHHVAGVESGNDVPYAVFSFTGLLFWQLFSGALSRSSNSLTDNQGVITKIYFPRIIPTVSATIVSLVDFLIAFGFLVVLLAWYGIMPGLGGILFFIPAVLITVVSATGIGLLFATLNVKYRDVRQALPFFVQIGLFLTPVIYPITAVPDRYQWLLYLNPLAGVISALRAWSFEDSGDVDAWMIGLGLLTTLVLTVIGLFYFKAKEREFADYI